jgi:hypothetical protein
MNRELTGLIFLLTALSAFLLPGQTHRDADANPYKTISQRNVFGLKAPVPPPPESPVAPPRPLPEITLTGIADFSLKKWALLVSAEPGKPPKRYTLREGQQDDGLEVRSIDVNAGTVSIRYEGTELLLAFTTLDQQPKETRLAETRFVDEHTRAHEEHERRERQRAEHERALAAVELMKAQHASDPALPVAPNPQLK